MIALNQNQILFCFCGPGGSGKSTVCTHLLKKLPNLNLSISTTSRVPRGKEVNGKQYHFITEKDFEKRISESKFIEHAKFNANYYGTEFSNLEKAKEGNADLLLDIDIQGVIQLKKLYPKHLVTIFIFPPTFEILVQRFRNRGTDDEAKIKSRLEIAKNEIKTLTSAGFSDYLLINDNLEQTIDAASGIIQAERKRFHRFDTEYLGKIFGDWINK